MEFSQPHEQPFNSTLFPTVHPSSRPSYLATMASLESLSLTASTSSTTVFCNQLPTVHATARQHQPTCESARSTVYMSTSLSIVLSSTSPLLPLLPSPLVSSCTLHQHHMHGASCMALTSSPFLPPFLPRTTFNLAHVNPTKSSSPSLPRTLSMISAPTKESHANSPPSSPLSVSAFSMLYAVHTLVSATVNASRVLTVFSAHTLLIPFMDPETPFVLCTAPPMPTALKYYATMNLRSSPSSTLSRFSPHQILQP